MTEEVIYKSKWGQVDLCAECGFNFYDATRYYWGQCCPECGQVGSLCPEHVTTARRFVCTHKGVFWYRFHWSKEKRKLGRDLGYYEWSGKTKEGKNVKTYSGYTHRVIAPSITSTIAAASVAIL